MKELIGKAGQGLPSLIGVLWGIYLYSSGPEKWWLPISGLLGAFVVMRIGQWLLNRSLVGGCALIELWVAGSICIVALGTMCTLWLTVHAGIFLAGTDPQQKAISGALVGAVTAYLAVLWTKDIQASKGPFYTGKRLKEGLIAVFKKEGLRPDPGSTLSHVLWKDEVESYGLVGWGLCSRWRRCGILVRYLKELHRS